MPLDIAWERCQQLQNTQNMTKYFLILIICTILTGCLNQTNNYQSKFLPIDSTELKFKKGDCISFTIDNNQIGAAIVIDFSKDEGGLWYGLCFTDYLDTVQPDLSKIKKQRLAGRRIESSLGKNGYIIGFDTEFVNDSCFRLHDDQFKLIGNLTLKTDKIRLGAEGATNDYEDFILSFQYSRERRKTPPDDYRDNIKKLDKFRPDEYFKVTDYINE
jgi:hypothetical protein